MVFVVIQRWPVARTGIVFHGHRGEEAINFLRLHPGKRRDK